MRFTILSFLIFSSVFSLTSQNLLKYGNFDDLTLGGNMPPIWERNFPVPACKCGAVKDAVVSVSPPYSCHIYTGFPIGHAPSILYQDIPSEVDKRYKGSIYIHGRSKLEKWIDNSISYLEISYLDKNKTILQHFLSDKKYKKPRAVWEQLQIPPTPPSPSGTAFVRFAIHLEKPDSSGQSVINVDDCILEEVNPCNAKDDVKIDFEKSTSGSCDAYDLKVKVSSKYGIDRSTMNLLINDVPFLKPGNWKSIEDGHWEYQNRIPLLEDRNFLTFSIADQRGCRSEKDQIIDCSSKANVYLLSIGVDYPDRSLSYTGSDAKDFANRILSSYGTSVTIIDTLWGVKNTDYSKLRLLFRKLRTRADRFRENDILYIYLSGHGKVFKIEDLLSWCLLSSDVKYEDSDLYCFDILELIENLKGLPCKKALFVDACDRENSEPLNIINQKNFFIATSASENEKAYECDKCENGIFTEALLKLFTCDKKSSGQWITAETIKEQLPDMVHKLSNDCNKPRQNPQFKISGGDEKMPVFLNNCPQ